MADRRVRQTRKDPDGDITALCNTGEPWSPLPKSDAIADIESGRHTYYVEDSGGRSDVVVVEDSTTSDGKYLRTEPNGSATENLDSLPDPRATSRDRLAEEFETLITNSTADTSELVDLLEEIGRLNGGLVAPTTHDEEEYFVGRVRHAMDRQAIYYANVLGGRRNSDFLGDAYVRELVEDGEDVEDRDVASSAFVRLRDPDSVALMEAPNAATYHERFLDQGTTLAAGRGDDVVLDELTAVRDRLRSHAVGASPPTRYANSFMLEGLEELRELANDQIQSFEPTSNDRVAVLYNSVYFDSLLEALGEATECISVLMFYFPYDGRRTNAVTTEVFRALVDAHKRDVAVEVVLDRDQGDQKYGTRHINANTIRALREAGVNARFDSRDHVTHSKVITIDDRLTYVGAHNLTNASNYLYEEVSLLLRSTSVAEYYRTFIAEAM